MTQPPPSPWPASPWPPAPGGPPGAAPPAPPPGPRPRPKYSRFAALVLSLFSPGLYRDVARGWRGIGLLYLLLLITLAWIPPIARAHFSIRRFAYGGDAAVALRQFPSVTIRNGVVSIAEPEPFIWKDPATGETLLYIDTTDAFDRPEAAGAKIRLGKSSVEVRNNPRETRVYDLSGVKSFYLDKSEALAWLRSFADWFPVITFPAAVLWSLVWGLVRLLIYGVIGLIFVSAFNARLDYAALMRLAAVAMTPGMALDTLAWTFNFGYMPCCGWSALIAIITLIYLGFGVKVNADAGPPPGAAAYPYPYPYPYPSPYPGPYPSPAPQPPPQSYPGPYTPYPPR